MKSFKKSSQVSIKSKESYIVYHFLHSSCKHIYETKIPNTKIQKIFTELTKKYGENNHTIQEYSLYSYEDMELTLYMDGSNFCRKKKSILIEDPYIKDKKICSLYVEKKKVHNDSFPSLYDNIVYDIIDIVFILQEGISLVIQTKKENIIKNIDTIYKLGIPKKSVSNKNIWCEIFLQVDYNSHVDDVHSEIEYIYSLL